MNISGRKSILETISSFVAVVAVVLYVAGVGERIYWGVLDAAAVLWLINAIMELIKERTKTNYWLLASGILCVIAATALIIAG